MADDERYDDGGGLESETSGGVATAPRVSPAPLARMPQWQVLLHNDDINDFIHVIGTIVELTRVARAHAIECTYEAHSDGVALILNTHQERAELLCEQFASQGLTVTAQRA